jgi:hypothetical protein
MLGSPLAPFNALPDDGMQEFDVFAQLMLRGLCLDPLLQPFEMAVRAPLPPPFTVALLYFDSHGCLASACCVAARKSMQSPRRQRAERQHGEMCAQVSQFYHTLDQDGKGYVTLKELQHYFEQTGLKAQVKHLFLCATNAPERAAPRVELPAAVPARAVARLI